MPTHNSRRHFAAARAAGIARCDRYS